MRNFLAVAAFFVAVLFFSSTANAQSDQKGLARVNKKQGKEIYIMCEPVREYVFVDKVNSTAAQLLGVSPTIENMVDTMLDKAVNRERKGKIEPFDALIFSSGDEAILVKFKDS